MVLLAHNAVKKMDWLFWTTTSNVSKGVSYRERDYMVGTYVRLHNIKQRTTMTKLAAAVVQQVFPITKTTLLLGSISRLICFRKPSMYLPFVSR